MLTKSVIVLNHIAPGTGRAAAAPAGTEAAGTAAVWGSGLGVLVNTTTLLVSTMTLLVSTLLLL